MVYTDYDYYSNTYNGDLTSDQFDDYITKASKEIDRNLNLVLTAEIIAILSDTDQDNLEYATCEMVDLLYDYNTVSSTVRDVKSLSIDGVSKTYQSVAEIKADMDIKKSIIIDDLPHELTRYL